jgi:death-on-curing protein
VGDERLVEDIQYPSVAQVSRLYGRIIEATGGEHGYLSKSNLDYLLDTVKDVGERLPRKQAIVKKAAFLLYNVIVIHPFLNGNKRTAYEVAKLFLASNGYTITVGTPEAYRFLLGVASGKISENEVETWVARHLAELVGG